MRPLYDTRSTPDVLLEVSRGLAKPLAGLPNTFEEYLECGAYEPTFEARLQAPQAPSKAVALDVAPTRSSTARPLSIPYHFMPVRLAGPLRRIARAPAVAAGDAGSDDLGHVVQLGGDQREEGERARHRAGRSDRSHVDAGQRARAGVPESRHRAGCGGDAGGAGPHQLHALRHQSRREPDRDSGADDDCGDRHARVVGDARQDRARSAGPISTA